MVRKSPGRRFAWFLFSALFSLIAAMLAFVGHMGEAMAHSEFAQSFPASNAVLAQPPTQVSLHFRQPVEPRFSKISLHRAGDDTMVAGDALVDAADRRHLYLPLPAMPVGSYVVRWVAVALDGHRTQGEYHFVVRAAVK